MIVLMKGRRTWEMVWSTVEGIGFYGQVLGLKDKMMPRISSVARSKNVSVKVEGDSCVCSVGVKV